MRIGDREVGINAKPYFIADIAANHDGDIKRALHLIELAKESGADAAKFQNFKARKIVSEYGFSHMGKQLSHQASWEKSVFETYDDASIPDDWTPILKAKCDEVGIEYMTSPYDFASVDWADAYVHAFKIGSGDISWLEMIRYIALKGKPVLLATGAASMEEVSRAVAIVQEQKVPLVLMQCNTNYTANRENFRCINLNVLKTYAEKWPDLLLGLSDHTKGFTTVLGAIALGARVIEKHFTDDNERHGPDHKFSTTPTEWREMVEASLDLCEALGDGVKRVADNEKDTCIVQKRGLYLTRSIKAGQPLSANDLEPLRPRSDDGFEPWEKEQLVGKKAKRDLLCGEMLKREDV